MGVFDFVKKLQNFDDDAYDDEYDEITPASRPERKKREFSAEPYDYDTETTSQRSNNVVNIHATTRLQVVLVKPDKFESVSEIADHLKNKRTVVLNLEKAHRDVARRLFDFLSGVAYANEGKIQKVANNTYIITPYNVGLIGDLIDELENNGLNINF